MTNYQEQGCSFEQEQKKPTAWVIFDLDGVLLRWPQYHLPKEEEQADFFAQLKDAHENGVAFSVLTNRSPAAMQILAYQLGVDYGIWMTESGGSAYNVSEHKGFVLPRWRDVTAYDVPHARTFLEQNLYVTGRTVPPNDSSHAQFEPGMGWVKTVIIPPHGISPQSYYEQCLLPIWSQYEYASRFKIDVGKGIDIDPIGLSKAEGMEALLALNHIDPQKTPTIFIADAPRDIAAGTVLSDKGGFVGAVGNASPDFKNSVATFPNGIIAPDSTSYYSSVTHIFNQFFS